MQSNTITTRLAAGLLSLVMLLTLLPAAAFAVETAEDAAETESATAAETAADSALSEDAAAVQAMIDALPGVDDVAGMTAEEIEALYAQTEEAYDIFEQLDAEEMQAIAGVEKIVTLMDVLNAVSAMPAATETADTVNQDGIFKYANNEDGTGFIIVGLTDDGINDSIIERRIPDEYTGTVTVKDDDGNEVTTENVTLPVVEVRSFNSKNVTRVTLGKNIRVIGNSAFKNNTSLKEVVIPEDTALEEIGNYAFEGCTMLGKIGTGTFNVEAFTTALPASLKRIGSYAFYKCTALTEFNFASATGLETVDTSAFSGSGLTAVTLPAGLERLGPYAFSGCGSLKTLNFTEAAGSATKLSIGSGAFSGTGLENVTLPEGLKSLGHYVFSRCTNLTEITFPESFSSTDEDYYMGLGLFHNDTGLTTVTFKGTYLMKDFGTGGFENYMTFEGVKRNCTVVVPKPKDADEYNKLLDNVYSAWRGAATATVKLQWANGTNAKDAPNTPAVTEKSLSDLNTSLDASDLRRAGITITTNEEGCAAVITVKKGSGTKASLEATLEGAGSVYWVEAEAFTSRTYGIGATSGSTLTKGMLDYVYRQNDGSTGSATINLNTNGKKGRTVFYFPVATNYGDANQPESSTIGTPVKVKYVADNAEPSLVTNSAVTYVNDLPSDNGYVKADDGSITQITNAYDASAPDVFCGSNGNGTIQNTYMRDKVVVPGFENNLSGDLVKDYTCATNHQNDKYECSIRYSWYIAYEKDAACIEINRSDTSGFAVYAGQGSGGLLWRIGRPSKAALEAYLKPGMNFLYAKITVTQNGDATVLTTGVTEFYVYGDDFQVALEISNMVGDNVTYEKYDSNWEAAEAGNATLITETGVKRNADRVVTVKLNEAAVTADTDEAKAEKVARYQAMFDACYEEVRGMIYFSRAYTSGNNTYYATITDLSRSFSTTSRSFSMPTEKLGMTYIYDDVNKTVNQISLGNEGGRAKVYLRFADNKTVNLDVPVYCCVSSGDNTVARNGSILLQAPVLWGNTEGTALSPSYDLQYFKLYLASEAVKDEWNNGKYVLELYQTDDPDHTRGGEKILTIDSSTLDQNGADGNGQYTAVHHESTLESDAYWYINGEWWRDTLGIKSGLNLFYWKIYEKGNPQSADYSPVFARFQSEGLENSATVAVTAGQTEATFSGSTLELPFILRGANMTATDLTHSGRVQLMYQKSDGAWERIYTTNNVSTLTYGWTWDGEAKSNASTVMADDAVFVTVPFTVTLNKSFTRIGSSSNGATGTYDFFTQYGVNNAVTLKLVWTKYGDSDVYACTAESAEITVRAPVSEDVPAITIKTSATLDGTKLGNEIAREVQWQTDEDGKTVQDENSKNIPIGSAVILTATAYADVITTTDSNGKTTTTALPSSITWEVKQGSTVVATLDEADDEVTDDNGVTFKVTSYTKGKKAEINRKVKSEMVISVSAPTDSSLCAYTLTPKAKLGKITATAPFYTITHNPASYAQQPGIRSQPEDKYYRPGTDPDDSNVKPLKAEATVSDGGTLSWQWYRALSSSNTTGTKIEGACGTGGEATYKLTKAELADVGTWYYFCRFTNTNVYVTSNEKTRSRLTRIATINVSDGLVEVETPLISGLDNDEFTFNWANYDQLSDDATTLMVKKPTALKGAEPSWVTFPTPRQSEVVLDISAYRKDGTDWVLMTDRNGENYTVRYGLDQYKDGSTGGRLTRTEVVGGNYVYSDEEWGDIREALCDSYSSYGVTAGDTLKFELKWTVTNELDWSGDSDFPYPNNLMGESKVTATHTVTIMRTPVEAPEFTKKEITVGENETLTADFQFEDGVPVSRGTGVTPDALDSTGYPVITMGAWEGLNTVRTVSVYPQWEGSRLARIEASVEMWNSSKSKWEITSSYNKNCSRTAATALSLGHNAFDNPAAGNTTFCRIALKTVENGISSPTTYSGVFAINWVEPTDAEKPVNDSVNTDSQTWHYRPNADWTGPETSSLTLGQATELWTAPDNGTLTYQWSYYYYNADNNWTSGGNIAGATDSTLTLSNTDELVQSLIAVMKGKANSGSTNYAIFILTVTNTNPLATGNRTATTEKNFGVYFKTAITKPTASIQTPTTGTTVSVGTDIPLTLNVTNLTQMESENGTDGTVRYEWRWRAAGIVGEDVTPDESLTLTNFFSDSSIMAPTLKTMNQFYYRVAVEGEIGEFNYTYFNSAWWKEHPNAQVKLLVYCTVTHEKTGYDAQTTTAPLELTLTAPTFNKGLEVKTYDANDKLVKTYALDPTETVIVPKNGKAVLTLTRKDEAFLGWINWYSKTGETENLLTSGEAACTVTYEALTANGGSFDAYAYVCASANTSWAMDTVHVTLAASDVAAPQLTLTDRFINPTDTSFTLNAKPSNADDITTAGGTLSYKWYLNDTLLTAYTGEAVTFTLDEESNAPGTVRNFKVEVTNTVGAESATTIATATVTTRKLTLNGLSGTLTAYEDTAFEKAFTIEWIGEDDVQFSWNEPDGYYVDDTREEGYYLCSTNPTALNGTTDELAVTAKVKVGEKEESVFAASVPLSITVDPKVEPTGVTVKGEVSSYNPGNATTIQLMQGDEVKYTATIATETGNGLVTQTFTLTGVVPGTYDLVVTKACHLTYTVTGVVVGSTDLDLTTMTGKVYSTITLLCGDIDGNKKINGQDFAIILSPANYNLSYTSSTDVGNVNADLDGNGKINGQDFAIVLDPANYNKTPVQVDFKEE